MAKNAGSMSERPFENLTEDNIKVAVIRHLKGYYRNFEQEGDELVIKPKEEGIDEMELYEKTTFRFMKSGLDFEGEGGIIVDGFVSFPLENGQVFLATFEATSFEQRKELFYQRQPEILFWDSLAVSSFVAALIFIGFHVEKVYFLYFFGSFLSVVYGILAFGAMFLLYYYTFKHFSVSRYRYIYAIEQFKRYFAQDQWVAFSEDVFPDLTSRYFLELKKQCVKNGVGLIKVDRQLKCQFLYTAARKDTFKKQRRHLRLHPQKKLIEVPTVEKNGNLGTQLKKWFPEEKRIDLLRFKHIPYNQFLATGLSFLAILIFLIIQWYNGPIRYVNEQLYEKKLAAKAKKFSREPVYYVVDTPMKPGEFDTSGLKETDIILRKLDIELEGNAVIPEDEVAIADKGIIMSNDADTSRYLFYDCNRFAYNLNKFYLVTDTIVPSFDEALERIDYLKSAGINGTAIWRGCLRGFDEGYLLYFDDILTDSLEAASLRDYYQKMDINGMLGLHPDVTVFIGSGER